ncbi:MAG: Asp-tRNA(Asn)/Glu-tRNA(Gln) amidotransferase subunit GatB [Dethiobacter sp.]|jgi:aspartyl-tRNA(Asn)/glutamyl-tRNA(Gln) amidotransferase subunit B|nr:MAG: Asp-tRNA(Asn)/Glu-tRNA(Gln) amidotransferase subunit GatB [Dethiobacter sp.]
MPPEYEVVIGLETHVELLTESKIFCSCPNRFGEAPNTNVCPVCLGLPGSLPVFNKNALELALRAALALNCTISSYSKFDRKNYFYPDLPKAYQISQYDKPLARDGYLDLVKDGRLVRTVRIERLHLEEDAGKLLHSSEEARSYVDYNRCGVPLVEIVTAPDLRSPEEAHLFLELLRKVLLYTGVSDCKMEEGSLRCDANISLRLAGSDTLGRKVEIKNMNSFKAVQRGLEYEVNRQEEILKAGGQVAMETRRWNEERGITVEMRGKEEEHDYRYFPEPDLPPIVLNEDFIGEIRSKLPELPVQRCFRLIEEYGLSPYQAEIITSSKNLADYFEETLEHYPQPQKVTNWLIGDVLGLLNSMGKEINQVTFTPVHLSGLLKLLDTGTLSGRLAKEVLEESFLTGKHPEEVVQEKGLAQISDEQKLLPVIDDVLKENSNAVSDYARGNKKTIGFLVGQVMQRTRGQANPQLVTELLKKQLDRVEYG